MDKNFAHYYSPTEDEFKAIWKNCIFIFDTNVLLNIYEYSEENRKIFFDVLKALKKRIWIPYHVGLEFHKNRFSRIRNAGSTLSDLNKGVETALSALSGACEAPISQLKKKKIDIKQISERINQIQSIGKSLLESIATAKEALPRASMSDEIGKKVSELFTGKVGERPATQDDLQKLIADADTRMEHNIPPGFEDKGKGDATFHDHGIRYSNKHGDLIIWKQIIAHAKKDNNKSVVFVTGDSKSDWWLCEGPLTLGPRVELVQEIITETGIPHFWMYNVEKFLEHSRDILDLKEVTDGAIEQAKDIAKNFLENFVEQSTEDDTSNRILMSHRIYNQDRLSPSSFHQQVYSAISGWLRAHHVIIPSPATIGYDFIAIINGVTTGIDVQILYNTIYLKLKIQEFFSLKLKKIQESVDTVYVSPCLVIVSQLFENTDAEIIVKRTMRRLTNQEKSAYKSVILGSISQDGTFEIQSEMRLG